MTIEDLLTRYPEIDLPSSVSQAMGEVIAVYSAEWGMSDSDDPELINLTDFACAIAQSVIRGLVELCPPLKGETAHE
jgi:hypothetical protein